MIARFRFAIAKFRSASAESRGKGIVQVIAGTAGVPPACERRAQLSGIDINVPRGGRDARGPSKSLERFKSLYGTDSPQYQQISGLPRDWRHCQF